MFAQMLPSYLSQDPEIMGGALVFAGTRVPPKTLIDYLAEGATVDAFLEDFPSVKQEHALALLEVCREEGIGH